MKKSSAKAANSKRAPFKLEDQVTEVVASIKRMGSKTVRDGMVRYGLPPDNAFGIPVGKMQKFAKDIGRNHELALALWETGYYEARMIAAFIDDPSLVTPAQMDRWCKDFDNWGIVDTVCFKLFDQSPHAWKKVVQWSKNREEFQKRAAFALLASLSGHDKTASNERFLSCLPLIEKASMDERNFVKKGVSWALRSVGRRNLELNAACTTLAQKLSASSDPTARWLGKEALREFKSAVVARQLKKRAKK
jgi:3-methyladenine DNA glycosylase AlkD